MKFTNLLTDEAALGEIGERIARLRVARRWTQAGLAEAAGVSKSTVERLEGGSSTQLSNLLRVLRALSALENLERLLPASPPSPIDLLERRGKVRQRVRQGGQKGAGVEEPGAPWSWGED